MSNIRGVIDIDSALNENMNGAFGESVAESRLGDVLVQFQYDYFDESFDVKPHTVTGDGTSSCSNSIATVSSATTGTAVRESRHSIRYRPAHTGYCYFTASFNGTGVGRAGCFDDENGFVLQVSNGSASFGYEKGGLYFGSSGTSGLDSITMPSGIDLTKMNIYMITFGYLGVANPILWVKKDKWYVVHEVLTEGRLNGVHVNTPVFPIAIYAENGMSVSSGSWSGGTIGEDAAIGHRGFAFPNTTIIAGTAAEQGEMTTVSTNVNTIALFRAKSTFKTKTNHVQAKLTGFSFSVDAPAGNVLGTVIFQIIGNPTITGTPTYSDINTNSSAMEYDHVAGTGATATASAGVPIITKNIDYVGANKGGTTGDAFVDADSIGAYAYAGDTFAIVAKDLGGNGVTVRITLNWEELF